MLVYQRVTCFFFNSNYMDRSTIANSWVNQLFRLGHGFQFAKCECLPEAMNWIVSFTINDDIMMITSCKKKMRATCHQQKNWWIPKCRTIHFKKMWNDVHTWYYLYNWYYNILYILYDAIWCYIMLCIASRLYYIYICSIYNRYI